jgi:hypothetical protein
MFHWLKSFALQNITILKTQNVKSIEQNCKTNIAKFVSIYLYFNKLFNIVE